MDRTLADSLLDEIGQKCEHKDRERTRTAVTDVYLNVYDMVGGRNLVRKFNMKRE